MYQASATGIDEYKRTTEPVVVGPSVLAMKYKGGVLIMADTSSSYGSLARYTDLKRIENINSKTTVSYSGELSDWQYLHSQVLTNISDDDAVYNDGIQRTPSEVHALVSRVMHNYRNKANPLYNNIVTAGIEDDGTTFLGQVDLYGTNYVDNFIATGFGAHISIVLLRKAYRDDLTLEECKNALEDAMRVLVYRHCRTINKFQLAQISTDGTQSISEPYELSTEWSYKRYVKPTFQEPTGPAAVMQ